MFSYTIIMIYKIDNPNLSIMYISFIEMREPHEEYALIAWNISYSPPAQNRNLLLFHTSKYIREVIRCEVS